jgi:hypothetical protein
LRQPHAEVCNETHGTKVIRLRAKSGAEFAQSKSESDRTFGRASDSIEVL